MVNISIWLTYLTEKLNRDLYVLGANGENIVDLLPVICKNEAGNVELINNILNLLYKRLKGGFTLEELDAFDCSGLFAKFALEHGIFKQDMTANDIYNAVKQKVPVTDVQVGDFVFKGDDTVKTHIGYAIDSEYAIESRGTAYGVVKTRLSERPWKYAVRPDWWEGIDPKPYRPVLTRELYYTKSGKSLMRGDDVLMVQARLNALKYSCGTADGVFGKKTDIAVRNFQTDNGLVTDGIVGKNTANKLGFDFEEGR